jgi:cobalt/nickel transport system permease protein
MVTVIQTAVPQLHHLLLWLLFLIPYLMHEPEKWGRQMLMAEPFLLFVGISYLFMQRAPVTYYGLTMSQGAWAFLSLFLRGSLAVMGITAFIHTLTVEGLASGMRWLKVPETFILILMQTYRYIGMLSQKVRQMTTAYRLRSGGKRGVHLEAWGSFPGQLLLLSLKQAEATHDAMILRGYHSGIAYVAMPKLRITDLIYAIIWLLLVAVIAFML